MELFKYDKGEDNDSFAFGCFGIVLLMISPLIIGNIGVYLTKSGGQPCGEATDCFWAQVPNYAEYTVPFGGLLLLFYIPIWLVTNYEVTDAEKKDPDSIEDSKKSDEP
jgi:hypothetical protein